MATAKLYLDKRSQRQDKTFPLKISVSHQRNTILISLDIFLMEDQFLNNEVVNHKQKKMFNEIISLQLGYIQHALIKLRNEGKLRRMSPSELKKILENNGLEEEEHKEYLFKDHIEEFISTRNKSRTKELYQDTLNKIQIFDNINKLTFDQIDSKWLKKFEIFMSSTCDVNTRAIHLRNIRAVFNDAINNDIISLSIYPFRKFKIKKKKTIKRSLTIEELIELRDYPCEPYLERYRDIFMLIFYLIGINLVDILHLKEINNGRIEYYRAKTNRLYSIEVLPEAKAIIDKYKGEKYLLNIMDTYTNYRNFTTLIDKNLKKIGKVELLKHGKKIIAPRFPKISTYYARHTWATIAHKIDIPKDTIGACLGHGGDTETDIYIDFDRDKIDEANKKVINYLHDYKATKLFIEMITNITQVIISIK